MGLDMYLRRYPKVEGIEFWNLDPETLKIENPELYASLKQYEKTQGDPRWHTWIDYYKEVGYWRKANQIHSWFVINVQDGEDECNPYLVSKEKIEELLRVCKELFKDKNIEHAEEILPTQAGFFFGSTEYDEDYWADIANTIQILEGVLKETDWDKEVIVYQSSW